MLCASSNSNVVHNFNETRASGRGVTSSTHVGWSHRIWQGQRRMTVVPLCTVPNLSYQSTFAQALEEHLPRFRRCNQDDLGDRRRVENLARKTLREKMSPCIDRTNFDAS